MQDTLSDTDAPSLRTKVPDPQGLGDGSDGETGGVGAGLVPGGCPVGLAGAALVGPGAVGMVGDAAGPSNLGAGLVRAGRGVGLRVGRGVGLGVRVTAGAGTTVTGRAAGAGGGRSSR